MSKWNVESLKEHYDEIILNLKDHYNDILKEKDKALNAALISLNDRLQLLNELRGGVATKEEIMALEKMVDDLKKSRDVVAGKSEGYTRYTGYIIAAITIVLYFLVNYIKK